VQANGSIYSLRIFFRNLHRFQAGIVAGTHIDYPDVFRETLFNDSLRVIFKSIEIKMAVGIDKHIGFILDHFSKKRRVFEFVQIPYVEPLFFPLIGGPSDPLLGESCPRIDVSVLSVLPGCHCG
jgi:hypothetical protein